MWRIGWLWAAELGRHYARSEHAGRSGSTSYFFLAGGFGAALAGAALAGSAAGAAGLAGALTNKNKSQTQVPRERIGRIACFVALQRPNWVVVKCA
eukprot:106802-Prorocentrum_minimum.AAC.3